MIPENQLSHCKERLGRLHCIYKLGHTAICKFLDDAGHVVHAYGDGIYVSRVGDRFVAWTDKGERGSGESTMERAIRAFHQHHRS